MKTSYSIDNEMPAAEAKASFTLGEKLRLLAPAVFAAALVIGGVLYIKTLFG